MKSKSKWVLIFITSSDKLDSIPIHLKIEIEKEKIVIGSKELSKKKLMK